jgi:hypothetical protein
LICVSVAEPTVERCLETLQGLDFAEVRIDGMDVTVDDVKRIFSMPSKLVATFMAPGSGAKTDKTVDNDTRKGLLLAAIEAGARFRRTRRIKKTLFKRREYMVAKSSFHFTISRPPRQRKN